VWVAVTLMISLESQGGEERLLFSARMMQHTRRRAARSTAMTLRREGEPG
jgi:hypothetical protein